MRTFKLGIIHLDNYDELLEAAQFFDFDGNETETQPNAIHGFLLSIHLDPVAVQTAFHELSARIQKDVENGEWSELYTYLHTCMDEAFRKEWELVWFMVDA